MQTFITDYDFSKSAKNLDRKRLGSQIYEGIHILASLLDKNEDLINPKRDVSNHPAAKLWIGYERELMNYIKVHMVEWADRGYSSDINIGNYLMLAAYILPFDNVPYWVTDELIETHRSVLVKKDKLYYKEIFGYVAIKEMRYTWV